MSIGVPVFNTDVRVVTDDGRDARPGEIGELVIAGPQIIRATGGSRRRRPRRCGTASCAPATWASWTRTGWFYLVDRAKDMIVASGFKVWPREVEEVLYLHPAVREAAVVGIPDPYRGETIKAVVSLKPGRDVDADDIKAFVSERMAAYKYPRVVRDRRRAAEDDQRQDHAPAAQDGGRQRGDERGRGVGPASARGELTGAGLSR